MNIELSLQIEGLDHHPEFQAIASDGAPAITHITVYQWQFYFETWLQHLDAQDSAWPLQKQSMNGYELSLLLTNDAEIRTLNATYRQQDQATDVLAFAALEWDVPMAEEMDLPQPLGDLVISVETATQQAIAAQHSLSLELIWLASHGFLHLLGWDHPDREQLERMLMEQSRLLQTIDVKSPSWCLDQWDYPAPNL